MNHYGPRLRPIRGTCTEANAAVAAPHCHSSAVAVYGVAPDSSQVFFTFGTGSATPNVAGRQVKLPEREGNTSHTVPAPYQTVAVVLAGMVHVP